MFKPTTTLTELEREPIVYFGCTWTEIKRCAQISGGLVLPAVFLLMIVMPGSVLWLVPGALGWLGVGYWMTQRIRKHRVGKPLYYERHRKRVRRDAYLFIKPAVFQVERHRALDSGSSTYHVSRD